MIEVRAIVLVDSTFTILCQLTMLLLLLLINRTGNLTDLGKAGSLHEYVLKLHQDYGPIVAFWWAKTYVVSLASPEYWKEVNPIFDRPGRTVV